MGKSRVNQSILLVGIVAALAASASGQQLTLANPGFDAQTINLGGWIEGAGAVIGWTTANSSGAQHMPASAINPPAQDGLNHGYMNQNGLMYQVPQYQGNPVLVQANQTYKVALWVGRRAGNEGTYGGILTAFIQSSTGAGGIAEAVYDLQPNYPATTGEQPKNSWVYKTLYMSTGPNPDGLGGQLQIGFQNTSARAPSNQFWFAQIDIDAVTVESIQPVAISPRPANDDLAFTTTPTLQWDAAIETALHDVYLGESFEDVNNATPSTTAIYKGRLSARSFTTATLVPGKTYYWRVDEVSGSNVFRGEVWAFTVLGAAAYDPSPADGAIYVEPTGVLAWSAGVMAQSHDVYLGTNQDAVAKASTASPEFKGNRTDPNYPLSALDYDAIYYWRIDERNADGTVTQGSVWTFRTVPSVPVTDPALVGWWKLDDGQGKIVFDWSTRGNHGLYMGDPDWTIGELDGALGFTGYEYVECGNAASLNVTTALTLATWIRTNDAADGQNNPYVAKGNSSYALRQNTGNNIEFSVAAGGSLRTAALPISAGFNGLWHHVAGTYDGSNLKLYVDGQLSATTPSTGAIGTNAFGVNFARDAEQTWCWYNGALDDVRIYSRALTQAEIQAIMRGDPQRASAPQPSNGAIVDIPQQGKPLTWTPGVKALQHDVYLGTDRAAVQSANVAATDIYRGRQAAASFTPTEPLQWGVTYYWRIDEINSDGTITKGSVWSFTVVDYVSVDDMESYNDLCAKIYYTWRDGLPFDANAACGVADYAGNGTGMTVGVDTEPYGPERTIIHSGRQSLPLTYDNSVDPYYSETDCTFAAPQDWTVSNGHALKTLSLWYRGYPQGYGSFSYDAAAKQYSVIGSGNDIWNNSDQFHYVYMPLAGNGSMTVKVESVENTNDWAKGGIMIRQGLSGDAVNVCVVAAPSGRVSFQTRTVANTASASTETGAASITLPVWLRLTRDGDTFTGEYSTDGTTWQQMLGASTAMVPMSGDVYIGLVSTSHVDAATLCTSVFSNVTVEGTASSLFTTSIDVGIQVNDPAPFYVALQSGTSPVAVQHPDGAAAVLVGEWTEWPIPLSDFVGVDLAQVRKMIIGTGDKTPGGTGKLFIDDVRLYGE
jgi:regulation of enolase protein 1 (concanavalin A-like superfamily)